MSAIIIDLATRRRHVAPAYSGHAGFMAFLNDRVGPGWYVAPRRRPVRLGERPHLTPKQFAALEGEYRRRFGPIYHNERAS